MYYLKVVGSGAAALLCYPGKAHADKLWANFLLEQAQRELKTVQGKYNDQRALSQQACKDLEVERNRLQSNKTLLGLEESSHGATRAKLSELKAEYELTKQEMENISATKYNAENEKLEYRLQLEKKFKMRCKAAIADRDAQIQELKTGAAQSDADLSKQLIDARLKIKELEQANKRLRRQNKSKVAKLADGHAKELKTLEEGFEADAQDRNDEIKELKATKIMHVKTIQDQAREISDLQAIRMTYASAIKDRDVQLQELKDNISSQAEFIKDQDIQSQELKENKSSQAKTIEDLEAAAEKSKETYKVLETKFWTTDMLIKQKERQNTQLTSDKATLENKVAELEQLDLPQWRQFVDDLVTDLGWQAYNYNDLLRTVCRYRDFWKASMANYSADNGIEAEDDAKDEDMDDFPTEAEINAANDIIFQSFPAENDNGINAQAQQWNAQVPTQAETTGANNAVSTSVPAHNNNGNNIDIGQSSVEVPTVTEANDSNFQSHPSENDSGITADVDQGKPEEVTDEQLDELYRTIFEEAFESLEAEAEPKPEQEVPKPGFTDEEVMAHHFKTFHESPLQPDNNGTNEVAKSGTKEDDLTEQGVPKAGPTEDEVMANHLKTFREGIPQPDNNGTHHGAEPQSKENEPTEDEIREAWEDMEEAQRCEDIYHDAREQSAQEGKKRGCTEEELAEDDDPIFQAVSTLIDLFPDI